MQAPTLTDGQDPDRTTLRPHRPEEEQAVQALWHDEQVRGWAEPWDEADSWLMAVEQADDTGVVRFAGQVVLRPTGGGAADLGLALAPWARGRGVGSRPVRPALGGGLTDGAGGGGGGGGRPSRWPGGHRGARRAPRG